MGILDSKRRSPSDFGSNELHLVCKAWIFQTQYQRRPLSMVLLAFPLANLDVQDLFPVGILLLVRFAFGVT